MRKGKGFTLVELLAVIVILAVILAIAIPSISSMINNASRNALESSAKLVLKGIEYKMMEDSDFNPTSINETNIESTLNIDDSNYQSVTVKEINGIIYITIVGKNKWSKLTVSGTKSITKVEDTVINNSYGANAPVLTTGMTPIKWNGSAWVDTTSSDTTWYNYDPSAKQWANARTADGSMWVWIPRYIYKISSGWHTATAGTIDIQFSKGVDDNWNKSAIGNINLDESANASNNTWTNHPAFTFEDTELTGIWVAKFEASNDGSSNVKVVPNITSWRSISVNEIFNKARSMETNSIYGWGTTGNNIDTHMMKNTEWGAVSYLSKSTYGKNAEIWINNSNTFITGCAGDSVSDATSTTGCEYAYNTTNGLQASTTGNIYGIYDMSGGAWEYVSAYVDNNHTNLTTYGSSILQAQNKYKDIYSVGSIDIESSNYTLAISYKGDAIYETSSSGTGSTSWYGDFSYMTRTDQPWFIRGGINSLGTSTGVFYFHNYNGNANSSMGFRSVVIVGAGL
jgi:prepilin-type N-terminal cleavage/methylation domain-containing protein